MSLMEETTRGADRPEAASLPLAWISLPTKEEVLARIPEGATSPYGFTSPMGRLARAHDRIGPALLELIRQIMFEPCALSRAEREMLAVVTAAAQDCHY